MRKAGPLFAHERLPTERKLSGRLGPRPDPGPEPIQHVFAALAQVVYQPGNVEHEYTFRATLAEHWPTLSENLRAWVVAEGARFD